MNPTGDPMAADSPCPTCSFLPDYVSTHTGEKKVERAIARARKCLTILPGAGTYYSGESLQLSRFSLWRCPTCGTYYEYEHRFYSDPQSTMGLGRDEDDWYVLSRLPLALAKTRLRQLG